MSVSKPSIHYWQLSLLLPCLVLIASSVRADGGSSEEASAAQSDSGFVVIVHPDNPASGLSQEQLSEIFLRKLTSWPHGGTIQPVDQAQAAPARSLFSQQVLKRPPCLIRAHWLTSIYSSSGEMPPILMPSDTAVVAYVRDHPLAIGYVLSNTPLENVKALLVSR